MEFGLMRPPVFFLKLHFYYKAQLEKQKFVADLVRLQTLQLVNLQLPKSDQFKCSTDLWKFPWDEKTENVIIPEEQKVEQLNRMHNLIAQHL